MSHPFPEVLKRLVDTGYAEMQADPKHQLSSQHRREIYNTIKANTRRGSRNVQGWLAVITAMRVLPIFQEVFPENTLPQDLLDTAVGVLRGQVDDEKAKEMQDLGYHANGNVWGHLEEEMPWNADMAGAAAYHALKEARGQEPLQNLDHVSILGEVTLDSGGFEQEYKEYPEPTKGNQFADEDLCQIDQSDTAAPAAVASSCSTEGPWCDPKKLGMFWAWWLKEAIPEAWDIAHREEVL